MNRKNYISLLFWLFLFASCGADYQKEFDQALSIAVKNDDVKQRQWDALVDKMEAAISHGQKLSQNVSNKEELKEFIWKNYPNINGSAAELVRKVVAIDTLNIYLENSSSMKGYFPKGGNLQFAAPIIDLYNVGGEEAVVKSFLIGEEVMSEDPSIFRSDLSNGNIATGKESPLARIFEEIITSIKKNEVSFLITDAIMSGSNEDIAKNRAYNYVHRPELRQTIREVFQSARKKGLSVLIYRFEAPFKGVYYDYQNGKKQLNIENRPFFIFGIGELEHLKISMRNAQKELDFKPTNTMLIGQKIETITTYKIKSGKASQYVANQNKGILTFKEDAKKDAEVGIRVDLSALPDHLREMSNLKKNLTLSTIDHSTRQTIDCSQYIDEIELLNASTHEYLIDLVLPLEYLNTIPNKLTLVLNNEPDHWYMDKASEKDDGLNFEGDKTYALNYLLEGSLMGMDQMELPPCLHIEIELKK